MSTNNNATTDQNKRGGAGTTVNSSKVKVTDHASLLKSLMGTKLEPIRETVASLPFEIGLLIKQKVSLMLDLHLETRQRESTSLRINTPGADNSQFIPNSVRNEKNPVTVSALLKDDPDADLIRGEADRHVITYKNNVAGCIRRIADLEITRRNEKLQKMLYDYTRELATNLVIVKTLQPGVIIHSTKNELGLVTALNCFWNIPVQHCEILRHHSQQSMAAGFKIFTQLDEDEVRLGMTPNDQAVVGELENRLAEIIVSTVANLFRHHDEKDRRRIINAALRTHNQSRAQEQANQAVEMALDAEATVDATQINNIIEKKTKEQVGKEVHKIKELLRKKSLGDDKSQALKPTKNGRGRSNSSTKSRGRSRGGRQNQQQQPTTPESILRNGKGKGKRVKIKDTPEEPPSHNNNRTRSKSRNNRGSRGGSNNGGKSGRGKKN